jgi:predicted Zn-dependent protease
MAYSDYQQDRFLTINALAANSVLRPGQRVKIVTW